MSEFVCELEDARYEMDWLPKEEIIRCRDCAYILHHKYNNGFECQTCSYFDSEHAEVEPNGFCAWGENGGIKMKITDRESLAGAILENGDAAQLFYYCVPMLEEYKISHSVSTAGAIAGIIIAIHQILCGDTDYDKDFSVCISDLMHICIDELHR